MTVSGAVHSDTMTSQRRSSAQLQLLDGGRPNQTSVRWIRQSDIDWELDERTRLVGRQGVAEARQILQSKRPPEPVDGHRRAS